MAIEQREMVSTQVREHSIPEQPKKQGKLGRSRKVFSVGEKFLFVLFTTILVLFATAVLHTESQLNEMNREVQVLSSNLEEQTKKNIELSIQEKELSTYEKVWEKARALGLNLNEDNVKVVPGR